jgi:transketolase
MRDAFFFRLFELAKINSNVIVLASDFSAPSFDNFRINLPGQFINTGISEQNSILVAAGLAQSGKKVFVTSIAPFISMRCFEQIRLYAGDMNLNIKIVAVGAGFSYNTAGPTHHSVEDIAIIRTIPNIKILSPSCNSQVENIATWCAKNDGPVYVRLDRMVLDELYNKFPVSIDKGFAILKHSKNIIITTGYMTNNIIKLVKNLDFGVIDLFKIPVDETSLLSIISNSAKLVTIEEHIYQGGLGSYICELICDNGINIPLKRFAFDFRKGFYHKYGSRDEMHSACGIGSKQILDFIMS